MTEFRHILVPTDLGEPSAHALELAIGIAEKFGAKLTVLHTTWFPPAAYAINSDGIVWATTEAEKAALQKLQEIVARTKARHPATDSIMLTGEPWETILKVVNDEKIDLVVMGTHGRRGLARALIGSVAERVVRMSPVPVLTVSGPAT